MGTAEAPRGMSAYRTGAGRDGQHNGRRRLTKDPHRWTIDMAVADMVEIGLFWGPAGDGCTCRWAGLDHVMIIVDCHSSDNPDHKERSRNQSAVHLNPLTHPLLCDAVT